ncbi:hypothetical protein JRO89_XS12G0000700 [Xanthoceras sorbifolium]|uniref:Retrotransposon gag domain-containing protein n=1 Tax=Xanthoceras sorbifolium TaxID=99658 RepID=A0ABQ8HA38_9ROSI|nr:hypothetical protein JRO89_XS12G0000700 [Xanthoceras sorbifolium]
MDTPRRVDQRGVGRPARRGRTGIGRCASTARGNGAGKEGEASNMQNLLQAMTTTFQGGNRTQLQVVEQFRRLHPPSFEETRNPLDAEEWLRELNKVFSFMNYTEDQKVACAVFMLKGDASHWWEMTNRVQNAPDNLIIWVRFKELYNQKYFPKELRNEKESEFIQLT